LVLGVTNKKDVLNFLKKALNLVRTEGAVLNSDPHYFQVQENITQAQNGTRKLITLTLFKEKTHIDLSPLSIETLLSYPSDPQDSCII